MQQITATQFRMVVQHDPAWAGSLTEPVEVLGFCDMADSPITHLSPLLHFKGKDPVHNGYTAWFTRCKHLKVAEGNFDGAVEFQSAGIEKIGKLVIASTSKSGTAVNFTDCEQLKVAAGNYPGTADFSLSGIERIGNLVTKPNPHGINAKFLGCPNLRDIPQSMLTDNSYNIDQPTRELAAAHQRNKTAVARGLKHQPSLEI